MSEVASTDVHVTCTATSQLTRLAEQIADAPWIALDSESNSMFAYRERVCLVQLNVRGQLVLIDPLTTAEALPDLDPLRPALEDPQRTVFLHGGEYDVAVFKREYNISLAGVFDTQQAAAFLGWPKTSYAAVVERLLGVVIDKSFRDYNWGTRPLDPRAVDYALHDVRYLPAVAEALQAAVDAADLHEEVAIANATVMAAAPHDAAFGPDHVHRVKGQHELDPRQRGALQSLLIWRDEWAREIDRPAGRLINDRALLAIVRASPTALGDLKRLRLGARVTRRAAGLLAALERARKDAIAVPRQPASPRPDAATRARGERLRQWRRKEAQRREVPTQVVLPARAMEMLAERGCEDFAAIPQLGDKRVALYGDTLRRLCRE
ncbi:MAG: hypothetical protein B7733_25785 [Myxococcales bacterium FL481]|nr:MAG: hypothetical protein B7733_25785 [Myxococcales bacterium FL481]